MPELPRHRLRHRGGRTVVTVSGTDPQPEAAEALRFIRETMQQAGAFTAVSGRGLILVGVTAVVAAWVARGLSFERWLAVWIGEVCLAGVIAGVTIYRKAVATHTPLFSGPARKVAMGLLPAMTAGAVLTAMFYRSGRFELVVPMWMLLYGVGVVAGGAWSVAAVPVMGAAFMMFAVPAFVFMEHPNAWMAAGFGGLHIIFGVMVTRKYGG